jgi:hypothetical protein
MTTELDFYLKVLWALEELGIRYMVVGAYGASAYGRLYHNQRYTNRSGRIGPLAGIAASSPH